MLLHLPKNFILEDIIMTKKDQVDLVNIEKKIDLGEEENRNEIMMDNIGRKSRRKNGGFLKIVNMRMKDLQKSLQSLGIKNKKR